MRADSWFRRFVGACVATLLAVGVVGVAGVASAGAAANVWSVDASPSVPDRNFLTSVSCPSASFCVAVGYVRNFRNADEFTLVETWDGTSWTVTPSPSPAVMVQGVNVQYDELWSVSCTGPSFCMAVGNGPSYPLAEVWDGSTWRVMSILGNPFSIPSYYGVSCTTPSACIAVGSVYNSYAGRLQAVVASWDGSSWTNETTPVLSDHASLASVSCNADGSCIAVGRSSSDSVSSNQYHTLIEARTTSGWVVTPSPNPDVNNELHSVSCTSASSCIAVGGSGPGAANSLIESYDGTQWSLTAAPNPTSRMLNGISCVSATDCVAVGNDLPLRTVTESWDGIAWSSTPSPNPMSAQNLDSVSCVDTSRCVAVGYGIQTSPPESTFILSGQRVVPPDSPTAVTATAGPGSATLAWTAPADNGSALQSYTVTAWPSGTTTTVPATFVALTLTGLQAGTSYTFTVTATNAAGTSSPSAPSNPVIPGVAVPPDPGQVPALLATVRDGCTNAKIANLSVSAQQQPATFRPPDTIARGMFAFASLPAGDVTLQVFAPGYNPLGNSTSPGVDVTIDPGPTNLPLPQRMSVGLVAHIFLTPNPLPPRCPRATKSPPHPNAFVGTVRHTTNTNVSHLAVTVTPPTSPAQLPDTTGTGRFVYKTLPAGTTSFTVQVSAPGVPSLGDPTAPGVTITATPGPFILPPIQHMTVGIVARIVL